MKTKPLGRGITSAISHQPILRDLPKIDPVYFFEFFFGVLSVVVNVFGIKPKMLPGCSNSDYKMFKRMWFVEEVLALRRPDQVPPFADSTRIESLA